MAGTGIWAWCWWLNSLQNETDWSRIRRWIVRNFQIFDRFCSKQCLQTASASGDKVPRSDAIAPKWKFLMPPLLTTLVRLGTKMNGSDFEVEGQSQSRANMVNPLCQQRTLGDHSFNWIGCVVGSYATVSSYLLLNKLLNSKQSLVVLLSANAANKYKMYT